MDPVPYMRKASPAGSHTHSPPLWHCLSIFLHGSRVFLLRTGALYFPSVLGVINPVLLDNEYVQNSISVLLYAYAQGSEKMLRDPKP